MLALSGAALLVACVSTPPQATVQVFTGQPQLPPGTTYRFERLPLQAGQPGQDQLEAAADALLARTGLRRDDAAPRLSVQLAATQEMVAGPGWGSSVGVGIGGGGRGGGIGIGLGFPLGGYAAQGSQRVDVLMRDLSSGQVVFQSQASGAGARAVLLLEAALRDFPNAPAGMRQLPLADAAGR
ncbi:hypothetical protein ASG30_06015 [Ramlibacter sp. Leaf400]|nr:hypothetical protein ASG30_06015 [Ramlibacter sp. Leaf400]